MKTLISIVGTTGIGKTKLAIDLAKHFSTEIISCDSRQFFRKMEIGTAAPTAEELAQVPHHFVGNLDVTDDYSIGRFETDALAKLDELFVKFPVVVMVGGSMMYEKALISGLNDLPEANEENQDKLQSIWDEQGLEGLQTILKNLDEAYYQKVDLENPRRLLRAIDVSWQTGKKYSDLIEEPKAKRDFSVIRIGIEAPREIIYERINKRVDMMLEKGLLDEVKALVDFQKLVALNTVGYSEIFKFLNHEWSLEFAVQEVKKNSRRFAKRQLTWYRKETDINWVNYQNSLQESLSLLKKLNYSL
ncbi:MULTISPECIES: tRNA (adenosine(37)-N6)-dimethylallyltransferase MiaA [Amniculibacterium]|uniref:tRNA (adenosine(37)-N6)-dimethylallyltransferase MiaA n=1 Tax=Amniculibacterium TaxID=2715289 RepID=UPI000F5A1249|nr:MULTISPECIES: tRNA (adenosine(37)-N6)-dimethylallyltransferase MiaA [Amniculibacterium]